MRFTWSVVVLIYVRRPGWRLEGELVADATQQLNDVISLVVALQALKLAENSTSSSKYSYGWQRAEVLGALINGVFLLALCFSIGLEAVNRLVTVPGPLLDRCL